MVVVQTDKDKISVNVGGSEWVRGLREDPRNAGGTVLAVKQYPDDETCNNNGVLEAMALEDKLEGIGRDLEKFAQFVFDLGRREYQP